MLPSPLLHHPGAVTGPGDDPDSVVPAHFGDPLREQAALAQGRALSVLARDVVTVTGPDRLSWMTTLSSQVLTGLAAGDGGAEALVMDAQGRIRHALSALDDGRQLLLVTEAGRGEDLVGFLDSMRFMLRVEVTRAEDLVVLGALGDGVGRLEAAAREVRLGADGAGLAQAEGGGPGGEAGGAGGVEDAASAAGASAYLGTWYDPWPGVVEGGTSYDVGLEGAPHPGAGYRAGWVVVHDAALSEVVRAYARSLGEKARGGAGAAGEGVLAGCLAWEALRVEAGRPRQAREADARAIPHELDWLRTAVHLAKGCYPGQETVARTLNLGRPPRRLTILQLDGLGGDLPVPGATVRMGERAVGTVTSVVRHYELGPMALALLRRGVPVAEPLTVALTEAVTQAEGGEGVEVGRVAASQEPLVSPEGRAQASPSQRPGAGLRSVGARPGLRR